MERGKERCILTDNPPPPSFSAGSASPDSCEQIKERENLVSIWLPRGYRRRAKLPRRAFILRDSLYFYGPIVVRRSAFGSKLDEGEKESVLKNIRLMGRLLLHGQ